MIMPFGKHLGEELGDLPDGYLEWLYGLENLKPRLRGGVDEEYNKRFIESENPYLDSSSTALANQIIDTGFRSLAKQLHPDHGGDAEAMKSLNNAIAWLRKMMSGL